MRQDALSVLYSILTSYGCLLTSPSCLFFRTYEEIGGGLLADGVGETGVGRGDDHQVCGVGETQVSAVLAGRWQRHVRECGCPGGQDPEMWGLRPQNHPTAVRGTHTYLLANN